MKKLINIFATLSIVTILYLAISYPDIIFPLTAALAAGAVIQNGILGGGKNKVGPVIMSKWKAIDYIRAYATPSNPNTAAQQSVRTKFAQLVLNARQLLSTILKPFWDPFYSNKSGFNAFISVNYNTLDANNKFTLSSKVSQGTLETVPIESAVYTPATGELSINWAAATSGNGLPADSIYAVVYDKASKNFVAASLLDERSAANDLLIISQGLASADLILYLFATRGTGSALMVSDSTSSNVS